ncbi:unnamed protein product, partial [Ectocarpus sp. 6 AP-2014]
ADAGNCRRGLGRSGNSPTKCLAAVLPRAHAHMTRERKSDFVVNERWPSKSSCLPIPQTFGIREGVGSRRSRPHADRDACAAGDSRAWLWWCISSSSRSSSPSYVRRSCWARKKQNYALLLVL